jgi:molecular chaperone DnaK
MAATVRQFTENLARSGLMTAEQVGEFRAAQPRGRKLGTAQALADALVACGRLTAYQAQRILDGNPQGLILGNNVILEHIGSGGMGEVYKAEHRRMKRVVVVKILHPESTSSEVALRRFQREVEAVAKLSHPNIVTAYDADEDQGIHFLVMEYVDGRDLGSLITRAAPLDVDQALDYITQAARGLAYAHSRNVIHRDIKPGNLLVDRDGVVKVLDMGLARFEAPLETTPDDRTDGEDSITGVNQIVGTVDYMSPEQADSSATIDRRTDIYSLGCTLYRLLIGRPPYGGKSTIQKLVAHRTQPIPSLCASRPEIPAPVDEVFRRMVAKLPDDRYGSMQEVIDDLERCRRLFRTGSPVDRMDVGGALSELFGANHGEAGAPTAEMQLSEDTNQLLIDVSGRRLPAVGIDLGTTNSVVAYLDDSGRPQTLPNLEGDNITPSVVLFDEGDVIVGKEAIKAMSTDMERVAESVKRELGQQVFHKSLQGQSYPPEALQAWVLNKLRNDAAKIIGPFDKVVITVPAYFDEVRRKATQDAGYMAGFDVVDIINEPTAAAVAAGFQQGYLRPEDEADEAKNVLVYDLGGGTFDVTAMRIGGGEYTTLATDGDVRLGGRDWDQRLVDFVAADFVRNYGIDPRDDPNSLGRLLRECEDAKRTLSARSRAHLVCDCAGRSHRLTVTRQEFEVMTSDLLDRTAFTTRATIRAAGLQWSDVQRVLLVGGATRMPAVGAMLRELSGREPDMSVSPDEAVAHGAALHAGFLRDQAAGKTPRIRIRNVNSHSLGIAGVDPQTRRKQTGVLIPRNTQLPAVAKGVFSTSKRGQRSVLVQIVEGESDSPDDCVQIGRCVVRDLPRDLPAQTPVEVGFRYETNGRLTVRVQIAGLERKLRYNIVRENSMSAEQRNQWRQLISGLPPVQPASSEDSQSTLFLESGINE